MTKSILAKIGIIAIGVLIAVGAVLLICIALSDGQDVIYLAPDDGKTHSVEFENLKLLPGEQCEYTVTLKGDLSDCVVFLDFEEKEDKTLKNFARVRISADGNTVCDELLADVFGADAISLPADLCGGKQTELEIVYYLPEDVGNEAKNAKAVFELLITASNG